MGGHGFSIGVALSAAVALHSAFSFSLSLPRSRRITPLLLGIGLLAVAPFGCATPDASSPSSSTVATNATNAGTAGAESAAAEPFDPVRSSPAQRARIEALRARLAPIVAAVARRGPEALLLLERDELFAPLPAEDRALLEAIRHRPGADPEVDIPAKVDWVRVEGQVAHTPAGDRPIPLQLVTAEVHEALVGLDRAMRRDLGRGLLVGSGYRSPANQLFLIVDLMPRFDYSLEQTTAHVTLPGASDHNRVDRLGVDFVSESGVDLAWADAPSFIALPEYRWLLEHGAEYGFAPEPVAAGAPVSSPWHWRFVGVPAKR